MVTNSKPGKQKGFTLIEIMIALAVVSIAILALGSAMNHNTAMVSEVEKRLMAQWVASNIAAQTRLDLKVNRVKTGSDTSREEMGGVTWRTKKVIEKTEVDNVYKMLIEVSVDGQSSRRPVVSTVTAVSSNL